MARMKDKLLEIEEVLEEVRERFLLVAPKKLPFPEVVFSKRLRSTAGHFQPLSRKVTISTEFCLINDRGSILELIAHEIAHYLQHMDPLFHRGRIYRATQGHCPLWEYWSRLLGVETHRFVQGDTKVCFRYQYGCRCTIHRTINRTPSLSNGSRRCTKCGAVLRGEQRVLLVTPWGANEEPIG